MSARWVITIVKVFAFLPLPLSHALGAALGWLIWRLPTRVRTTTRTNIRLCFPHLSTSAQQRLGRQSVMETGKTFTEMGALWCWPPQRIKPLVTAVENQSVLHEAMQKQRGVILLCPHIGAWEMVNLYCHQQYPMTALYRPPRMQGLNDFILQARQRTGARLVPTSASGVRRLYQALAKKELIGILPDQDPGQGAGSYAPFFNIPANTMTLVSRLLAKTGATLIYAYAERLPRGQGYRMHFHPATDAIYDPDVGTSLTAMNQGVERCVREVPQQYQWSYKRFKSRPKGSKKIY